MGEVVGNVIRGIGFCAFFAGGVLSFTTTPIWFPWPNTGLEWALTAAGAALMLFGTFLVGDLDQF